MRPRALASVITIAVCAVAGCGLPLHNPGGYVTRDWPTATGGYTAYTVDTTVDRDPGSSADTRFYFAADWNMQTGPETKQPGYMGLQTYDQRGDGSLGRMAIVSLWTGSDTVTASPGAGTGGQPASCFEDASESQHVTCRIAYEWRQGHTYRYSFAKTAPAQWTAQITDRTASGSPVATLGTFTVPATWKGMLPAGSWIEQYVMPPETDNPTPVCPSRWATVRYEIARANGTVLPTTDRGSIAAVNAYEPDDGSPPTHVVCQNANATDTAKGVTLNVDTPNPAPATTATVQRSATSAIISWTAPRNPATIAAKELAAASGTALESLAAIARPLPTSYTVTATPGSHTLTVTAPTTRATVAGLTAGTTYTFMVTANNSGQSSAGLTAQG